MTSDPVTAELEAMLIRLTNTIESAAERIEQSAGTPQPVDASPHGAGTFDAASRPGEPNDVRQQDRAGASVRARDRQPVADRAADRSSRMARLVSLQQMYRQLQRGGVDDRPMARGGRSTAFVDLSNASSRGDRLMPVMQALLKVNQEMLAELRRAANQPSPGSFA